MAAQWPKHEGAHCVHKLISIYLCAYVGTIIVYDYIGDSSIKYFVAQKQYKGKPFLHFQANNGHQNIPQCCYMYTAGIVVVQTSNTRTIL